MIIHTINHIYQLEDIGDGGFIMSSNNPNYPGPVMVSLYDPPERGQFAYMKFLEGPKINRTLITTPIVSVCVNR